MKIRLTSVLCFALIQSLAFASGEDSDGDGYSDCFEFEWGSNPGDPSDIPSFYYATQPAFYVVDETIEPNLPFVPVGTTGFQISPPLPPGLVFQSNGTISGKPTTPTLGKWYTVTARNPNTPNIFIDLFLEVYVIPDIFLNFLSALSDYSTLGEFEVGGDVEDWRGESADISAAGGLLTVNTSGDSPRIVLNREDLTSGGENNVLEFRIRQPVAAEPIGVSWIDDSGFFAEGRSVVIEGANLPADAEFHVYQIDLSGQFRGSVYGIALDLGTTSGRSIQIDYVRIGKARPPAAPDPQLTHVSYDREMDQVELIWTSRPGEQFRLQSSPDLLSWIGIGEAIPAGAGQTTTFNVNGTGAVQRRYYRVVRIPHST